jgi:glycosyltransferase involved in cell wall biosynthesis
MSRVGIVTYDFYPSYGGQGRHTYELWRRLHESLGDDLRVYSPSQTDLPGHTAVAPLASRFGHQFGFSLAASMSLSRWAERDGIDLFHFNGGPGGVLLVRPSPVRYLYTAHHTYAQQSRLVPGQDWKNRLTGVEAHGYRNAEFVTADTESTARSVIDELGVAPSKVAVLPSGVDSSRFQPVEIGKLPESALFVGRLDGRKGFAFLLQAWRLVVAKRPAARLYVIGEGPLRKQAEREIAKQGLGGTVAFLGRVSEERLVEWYNAVTCVVVPSVFEGFGLTALEAVFCGTPVVATNSEGLRDVVVDGKDGRLAPYGDAPAFAEALTEALIGRGRLPPSRIKAAQAQYDWSVVAPRFLDVYERLLTGREPVADVAPPPASQPRRRKAA